MFDERGDILCAECKILEIILGTVLGMGHSNREQVNNG
jgi:hypothetical protein